MTNKIKDILKTHKYLLLSFFLPVLLLEGIAIAEKIQPFGIASVFALFCRLSGKIKKHGFDVLFLSCRSWIQFPWTLGVLSGKSTKSGDRTCVEINAYDDIKSFVCLKDRTVLLYSRILF